MNKIITLLLITAIAAGCRHSHELRERTRVHRDVRVLIQTSMGDMTVRLYDSTPLHRDNFIKLVRTHFYDSLLFHRVINGFMIQGGDPDSRTAATGNKLGDGGADMPRIKAEILPQYIHKRGALGAARDNNPAKESSGSQFYIVTGKVFDDAAISNLEARLKHPMNEHDRKIYQTIGGAPWLDGNYTVFGEVESGMEVADKIANAAKDANDRPRTNIRMSMKFIRPYRKIK